ncbi:MAG: 50S ribosomal protein L22 [Dehalococcoidia bacterium]|nr:50S ribosomal protein L22 [Dehalococcoidia bacterium]
MEVIAKAFNQPIAPRKVRLVLDSVRGQKVNDAYDILDVLPHKSARLVRNVILSAVANAKNNKGIPTENLIIKKAYADEGRTLKRFKARSRGRTAPRLKRYSHINIIVEEEIK